MCASHRISSSPIVHAAAIAGARSGAHLLTNTASHAHRISSSPIVTLSPNGRASSYSCNHPPSAHAASSASAECADAFVQEPTEVPGADDSHVVAEACAGSCKEQPDSVPDTMGQETELQVGRDSTSSSSFSSVTASAAADKKEQTENEKETWWECDYCSRAFTSLEVASTHELKCSRNPQVKQRREAEQKQEKAQYGELRRLLSPGHVCRSLLSFVGLFCSSLSGELGRPLSPGHVRSPVVEASSARKERQWSPSPHTSPTAAESPTTGVCAAHTRRSVIHTQTDTRIHTYTR